MAYRYEKNQNGEYDLVIDGWEKGIANSPFKGIGNIQNLNVRYYDGIAYVNYKRKPVTLQTTSLVSSQTFTVTIASPAVFTSNNHGLVAGNVITFTTTGTLPAGLSVGTKYFVLSTNLTTNTFEVSTSIVGSAVNTSGSQSGTHTFSLQIDTPKYATQSPLGLIYIQDNSGNIFKQSAVNSSTFIILSGCPTVPNFNPPNQGLQFWNNYLFAFSPDQLNVCGDGSGDGGIISSNWNTGASTTGVWPIKGASPILTGSLSAGATSATISSYTDGQGNSRAFWNGPSGTYPMTMSNGQVVFANLTQGQAGFSFAPALNSSATNSTSIAPINNTSGHPTLVSVNDGNMYIANGAFVTTLNLLPNQVFSKTNMNTFNFNYSALSLPPTETSIFLTELRNQLLVGTNYKIYPWDRFSPTWLNPIPFQEQLYGAINILNDVYIFAGNKGNIYITNGYDAQRFIKIPDYIAGAIDPSWSWGGIMSHRQRLWFQALATSSQTNSPLLAGIFSLDLDTRALVMESQNSFGLGASTAGQNGILIDNNTTALNYDNYYSAWSNNSLGGIDYNDTTLWSNNEPTIETDIIPIGTYAQKKSYRNMEFKLDQPLQSGDSITIYARQSLADSYVQIGTTTTAVLSDFYEQVPFEQWQWVQFKVKFSCNSNAASSSFNRLREIRVR